MDWNELCVQYAALRIVADATAAELTDKAREACKRAGLDPGLLGIHPHNAMVSYDAGHPWVGIDYGQVRLCLYLIEVSYGPHRELARWWSEQAERLRRKSAGEDDSHG